MDLVILIVGLALIGFLVYWVTENIPMGPHWKTLIKIIVTIVVVLYLLRRFSGILPNVL
jgi:uncharacterized protein (DUF983 family)